MSERSKIYPVKSNAARAAAQYGLTRGNLIEITKTETGEHGWYFTIPAGVTPTPQRKADKAAEKPADKPEASGPAEAPAKPKKAATAKKAAKPKAAKKPAKAKKAAKAKATGPKRKAGPRTGKTAEFIGECKARWTDEEAARKKYGWNSNTLRGVLGNYKLKTKKTDAPMDFIRKREDGKTLYRVVSVKEAERLRAAA